MNAELPDIVVVDKPIDSAPLRDLVDRFFGDMLKLVIDVRQRLVAVGGELHADHRVRHVADAPTRASSLAPASPLPSGVTD